MAQVKPQLTLDVNVGPSTQVGVGGSGTSRTPRAHQQAVNNKAQAQMQSSAYAPSSSNAYNPHLDNAYTTDPSMQNDFERGQDNGGFSSDDDAQDAYAAANSRLKAGSSSVGAKATRDQVHGGASYYQQQQQHEHQQQQLYHDQQQMRRQQGQYDGQESDSSIETDEYGHGGRHPVADGMHDDMSYEDEEDDEEIGDDESELSSSPSIPDENIDFDLVYALHNFVATVEGQATVHKGNSLTLLDDSNSYWWLVRVLRTQEVGYIPAENIETPFERLARLNKHRNVDLTSATDDDHIQVPEKIYTSHLVKARHALGTAGLSVHSGKLSALSKRAQGAPAPPSKEQRRNRRGVAFGPSTYLEHSGDEYSDYDEDAEGETMEYEEDPDAEYDEVDGMEDEQEEVEQYEHGQGQSTGFNKMEPDDGMEWDGREAERVQQQRQQEAGIRGPGGSHSQSQAAPPQSEVDAAETQRHQRWQQQQQQQEQQIRLQQQQQQQQSQRQWQNERDQTTQAGSGSSNGHSQRSDQLGPSNRPQIRVASAERSVSTGSANGMVQNDPNTSASRGSTSMSRNSTSSSNGFLPSQIQRERANSDASANSSAVAGESLSQVISPEKDKKRSSRNSKGNDAPESPEEKSGKKRSGVFSLFSRKDKKDRKSANMEDRDSIVGRSSEDSFAAPNRERGSPATIPNAAPAVVQAVNAAMAPGQSLGMGRAVQERDRAQQEAYQRQFLSTGSNSGHQSGESSYSSDGRRKAPRPGSLVGPSGSTPMLSVLRVFAGEGVDSDSTFKTVLLNDSTRSNDLQRQALQRFGVPLHEMDKYVLTIKRLEGDERPLDEDEHPLELFNTLTELLQEGQVTIPSVKRSSVGSISSISSNLSTHPAIARLGNDFNDDHAVKFYISRKDRLRSYVNLNGSHAHTADDSARSLNPSDLSASQDTSNATSLSLVGQGAARSSHSSVMSSGSTDTVQSPTARFSLRLHVYASDLPDGIVFDPQSNAVIPRAALRARMGSATEVMSQDRYREKILTFPRNTTVAEVVEEGLDRFGISEGVVEGGDDVEDRPSRRKSRLHVKYGLAVQAADGERSLSSTSKILDAYQSPPLFKQGVNKRRSIDAASLFGATDDIGPNDPVFVLRQITHAHASNSKAKSGLAAARALSPTEGILAAKHEARQSQASRSPVVSPRLGEGKEITSSHGHEGMTRQEIIAAQRAAAAERNAAVLGAQRNAQQGVDLVLSNQARIRSSKMGPSNKFRYSYLPVDGQERDISSIIEEVMRDQLLVSNDSNYTSSRDAGLSPHDAYGVAGGQRPTFSTKKSMQSDLTLEEYASARSSSGGNSPLSLNEVNFDIKSPESMSNPSVAPLSFGKQRKGTDTSSNIANEGPSAATPPGDGDLLDSLIRANPQEHGTNVEDRINAVLHRVQTPTAFGDESASTTRAGSRGATASPVHSTSQAAKVAAGAGAAAAASAAALGAAGNASDRGTTTSNMNGSMAHKKQASIGSELSGSRGDTASPFTNGTSASAATHATNTTGTMPTPLSTLVASGTTANARQTPTSRSLPGGSGAGSRSATPYRTATPASLFAPDDLSLSNLYTIVDAAARRDPRKARLMTHGSVGSFSSTTSPIPGASGSGFTNGGRTSASSRPGSKLSSHSRSTMLMMMDENDDAMEKLKPEPGGLFAPGMPFLEDKKVREAYGGIHKQLGDIDDGLDRLLGEVIKIF